MLHVVLEENRWHVPAVWCDLCQERIEVAQQGNYAWNMDADGPPEMHHVHKWCWRPFQSSNYTVMWRAENLDMLMFYLSNSLEVDKERVARKAKLAR